LRSVDETEGEIYAEGEAPLLDRFMETLSQCSQWNALED
jgi:hypothetical protein